MKRFLVALGSTAIALATMAGSASAYMVSIDNFTVTKNGIDVLNDNFNGGAPPPDGPSGAATYNANGTFAEGGGVATMETATGSSNVFGGTNFVRHNATFLTNTQPLGTSTLGLKNDDTLAVAGLFDLSIPTNLRESYGVYFTDNQAGNTGDDQLEMRLVNTQAGEVRIQFQRVNYVTQTSAGIQSILLSTAVGAAALADITDDQLLLKLERLSDTSDDITASYTYFDVDNGVSFSNTFANTATIFNGEDWTRAGFFARVALAVSEPAGLAILGLGLAGLSFAHRRRAA